MGIKSNERGQKISSIEEQLSLIFSEPSNDVLDSSRETRKKVGVITLASLEEEFKTICDELSHLRKLERDAGEEFNETSDRYHSPAMAWATILKGAGISPLEGEDFVNMKTLQTLIQQKEEKKDQILKQIADQSSLFVSPKVQEELEKTAGKKEKKDKFTTLHEVNKQLYKELFPIYEHLSGQIKYLSGNNLEDKYKRLLDFPENAEAKEILHSEKYKLFSWAEFESFFAYLEKNRE